MKFPISRVKYKIKLGINDNHRISNEGIIIAEQAVVKEYIYIYICIEIIY